MMKRLSLLLLALLGFTLTRCHLNSDHTKTGWPGAQPFPQGYGYMDTLPLQRALQNNHIDTIRQHAWSLFAGIMQPDPAGSNWPLWYTWPNSVVAMEIQQMFGEPAGNEDKKHLLTLIGQNKLHTAVELDTLKIPYYPMPPQVVSAYGKDHVFVVIPHTAPAPTNTIIIPGKHFMSNGDILIATESISSDGYEWIQSNRYFDNSVMNKLYAEKVPNLNAPLTYVVTKHMYWPVPAGQLSAIPVWDDSYYNAAYAGYSGYEKWPRMIAVDPTNTKGGQRASVSYLYGIRSWDSTQAIGPITCDTAVVHNMSEFYSHKVTQTDWDSFDANDKAILNSSSYWAYGKPFGVGDYLVTIAMHINTKELRSWTMQSVWWTDKPGQGVYSQNQPNLPTAQGPWKHYDLTDAYGIPVVNETLPVAMNPYIELVSHPMSTNCNTCHMRAGYPQGDTLASYQNPGCKGLLQKLYPTTPCISNYTRTDFQWIISDYTHAVPADIKK